jgi:methionyl-tRNA synthetase
LKAFKRILVTSALPYANGPLHLGHIAGAYLPADIYVRYQRLKKRDVIYICGSDEHGVPITVTADREGISPKDVVDRYHSMNEESFKKLGISFDNYSRTSLDLHHKTAQDFFSILYRKNVLTVKTEEQFYSEKTKRFLPDRYVEGTCPHCQCDKARGDQCDACGKWLEPRELINPRSKIDGSKPVLRKTQHWYFPMGRLASRWKVWFDKNSWKENVRNYCMGWYREGLEDRPITRDLHWGVSVPLKETGGKVLYVWFDAPIGYISSTKEWAEKSGNLDRWKTYWCDDETKLVHFIGKDNIVFHAILFPMMLMEAGHYVLPDAIPANEYLTIEGRKISTSENYAIWLKDYLDIFSPDPLRYTLAVNAPETKDTDFSWAQFQNRNNDELADILGNFINRTLTFVHRYYDGCVPERKKLDNLDRKMVQKIQRTSTEIGNHLEQFEIRNAVNRLMDLCRFANKYFNDKAPWETRTGNPEMCATTLNICIQTSLALSIFMDPVLPFSSQKVKKMLKIKRNLVWDDAGKLELKAGQAIGKPGILFEKIEDEIIQKESEKLKKIKSNGSNHKKGELPPIGLDEFQKIELKTAEVMEAERVKGADKLLKLQIDLGNEKRQIVAGIAESYSPEKIIGKTIVVVVNLKPAIIRGIESKGMLLAVKTNNGYAVLTTENKVQSGLGIS